VHGSQADDDSVTCCNPLHHHLFLLLLLVWAFHAPFFLCCSIGPSCNCTQAAAAFMAVHAAEGECDRLAGLPDHHWAHRLVAHGFAQGGLEPWELGIIAVRYGQLGSQLGGRQALDVAWGVGCGW
jgi:hypothetical protein